ncbi:hypothetical protein JOQ06_014238, partial [Pogonophryne albipinna]
ISPLLRNPIKLQKKVTFPFSAMTHGKRLLSVTVHFFPVLSGACGLILLHYRGADSEGITRTNSILRPCM